MSICQSPPLFRSLPSCGRLVEVAFAPNPAPKSSSFLSLPVAHSFSFHWAHTRVDTEDLLAAAWLPCPHSAHSGRSFHNVPLALRPHTHLLSKIPHRVFPLLCPSCPWRWGSICERLALLILIKVDHLLSAVHLKVSNIVSYTIPFVNCNAFKACFDLF